MTRRRKKKLSLTVLPQRKPDRAKGGMGRRRAMVLVIVHVLILLHIAHWWYTGSTLTPLEPSEASYSLRDGAINAGAIFFCLLICSTVITGRFFCGWACHLVACQDLARWLMLKVGVRPRPVRSRLLMLVPLFAVFWLYGLPLVERFTAESPSAVSLSWHLSTDDFWRTFPGPAITILSIVICGFAVVYFLGSKGFCTYGCPYGVFFSVADRVAKGRIRVTDACIETGNCTRTCSSNVDVASEVRRFGMVVDPGCMKCLDCVSGCPTDALYFGFSPSVTRKDVVPTQVQGDAQRRFDFSWGEEFLLVIFFAGCFVVFKDLFRLVPLLLALGLATIGAFGLLLFVHVIREPEVCLQNIVLKTGGRMRIAGGVYVASCSVFVVMLGCGAFVQWHTWRGVTAFERAAVARSIGDEQTALGYEAQVRFHLDACDQWSPVHVRGLGWMMGSMYLQDGDAAEAARWFRKDIDAGTRHPDAAVSYGHALADMGRVAEAMQAYGGAVTGRWVAPDKYLSLARILQQQRRFLAQREILLGGLQRHPASGDLALKLCRLLLRCEDAQLRDPQRAMHTAEAVVEAGEHAHADLFAMLAFLYYEQHRFADALAMGEASLRAAQAQGLPKIAAEMEQAVQVYRDAVARD